MFIVRKLTYCAVAVSRYAIHEHGATELVETGSKVATLRTSL